MNREIFNLLNLLLFFFFKFRIKKKKKPYEIHYALNAGIVDKLIFNL